MTDPPKERNPADGLIRGLVGFELPVHGLVPRAITNQVDHRQVLAAVG
jgi:hypothetical protein